jgi:hypothetical protein
MKLIFLFIKIMSILLIKIKGKEKKAGGEGEGEDMQYPAPAAALAAAAGDCCCPHLSPFIRTTRSCRSHLFSFHLRSFTLVCTRSSARSCACPAGHLHPLIWLSFVFACARLGPFAFVLRSFGFDSHCSFVQTCPHLFCTCLGSFAFVLGLFSFCLCILCLFALVLCPFGVVHISFGLVWCLFALIWCLFVLVCVWLGSLSVPNTQLVLIKKLTCNINLDKNT